MVTWILDMSHIINPHRFAAAEEEEGTPVVWDTEKWRCHKGKPSWDLSDTRFLGIADEVNHTITDGYGTGTHYAEFLVSVNDALTGAGVVAPGDGSTSSGAGWFTGTCSSDSASSTPTSSLNSYMTDQAKGTWKSDGDINIPGMSGMGDTVTVPSTSVSNRIGIEVDVVGSFETGPVVRFYEVESDGTRTLLTSSGFDGEITGMNDGIDFDPGMTGTAKASFAATSYSYPKSVRIYSASADWWGTPTSGYVAMTSD